MKGTTLTELMRKQKVLSPHLLLFNLSRLRSPFFNHRWQGEGVHQKDLGKA